MREWFNKLPSKLLEFWNKYTARQKTLFFSVLAALVVTLIALFFILNRTTYVNLASFENTAVTAQASNLLTENGFDIRVPNDGLSIEVSDKQLSKARLLLGENGISSNINDTDYSWLFDNGFNTTDSEKKLKAKINLQSTMAADISNIEGISKASVTINPADNTNSIYSSEENTSVSIMITIGSAFNKESVQGIAEYAKNCVGNTDTNDITIIDNQGNLLFSGTNSGSVVSSTIAVQQQVEEYYNSKLWNLMVNSGVYDEVSVSADLDVQLSQEEIETINRYSNDD